MRAKRTCFCPVCVCNSSRIAHRILFHQLHISHVFLSTLQQKSLMMCLDMSKMANPMKNSFTTFYGCIPISTNHVPEYMVVPAIMSNPCFWMIASHSFQMVANVTRIPFNPVSTNLKYVEFANNLYRFSSTIMLYLARFSFNRFTYSNMNGVYLRSVYIKPYERNQLK